MKVRKYINKTISLLVAVVLIAVFGCERNPSDDAVPATFPNTAEIFTDTPVGLGSNFYFPYDGSKATAWSLDEEESYEGSVSMRFDVPNATDPEGNYAGAIFRIDGAGRNLTGYDALTFWAKATQGVTISEFGFGEDFLENKFVATITNVSLSTSWQKIIIPIPDASKLVEERGMFRYAAGTSETNGSAYTFWVDELKFEKLGTIAQPRPAILNGEDVVVQGYSNTVQIINGFSQTFNLANGQDITAYLTSNYFEFESSNESVATVDDMGVVNILGAGTAVITASLNGITAQGSMTIQSIGEFVAAPTPTRDPLDVISIFSDAYTNVPIDFFNGYWEPYQTTQSEIFEINGNNMINYTNFNFVGNQFANPTIDATNMTNIHFDVFVPDGSLNPQLKIILRDFGNDGADGGDDDTNAEVTFGSDALVPGQWNSLEMSINDMANKNRLGLLIYENLGSGLTSFYLDNIYLYKIPTVPTQSAPTPTLAEANVISLFSDAYTDVPVDTWRTDWSAAATVLEDVTIDGDAAKKYTDLGFVGIETTSNTVDASNMTHFHIDVWSADFTSFNIKLVDFGADGAFNGGDDTEHELSFTNLAPGQWVSLDIPLSDFTGLTSTSNIAQYILVGQPYEVTDVYIDNVYFHN